MNLNMAVMVIVLFSICWINFPFVSGSDDRISRLEKLVDGLKLEFAKEVNILKNDARSQRIQIDNLETQLEGCKASHDTQTFRNTKGAEALINGKDVSNDRLQKELRRKRLLLSGLNGDSSPVIAFHAYLSDTEVDPGHHHTIIFDSVLTNSGKGYNNHSGTFIAPEEGVYVFAFTVVGYAGNRMPVQLVVNSNLIGATSADSLSATLYPSSSSIVIVHLNQGDTCFVRTATDNTWKIGSLFSSDWSRASFSGWKL